MIFIAGLLVLGAGGYHIAWLLWNLSKPQYSSTTLFLQFSCWYFGHIFGSIAGAAIVTKWQKKNIYVRLRKTIHRLYDNMFVNCST